MGARQEEWSRCDREEKVGEARGTQPAKRANTAWAFATLEVRQEELISEIAGQALVMREESVQPTDSGERGVGHRHAGRAAGVVVLVRSRGERWTGPRQSTRRIGERGVRHRHAERAAGGDEWCDRGEGVGKARGVQHAGLANTARAFATL